MDQVTTIRKHMKCEQWKSIITECRSVPQTIDFTGFSGIFVV